MSSRSGSRSGSGGSPSSPSWKCAASGLGEVPLDPRAGSAAPRSLESRTDRTLIAACRKYGVSSGSGILLSGLFDHGLVTDVPRRLWQIMACPSGGADPVEGAEDDPVKLAFRLLSLALVARAAAEGEGELDLSRPWPAAGAALMEPGVARRLDSLVTPSLAEHWRWLARVLPEPADELAHDLAQACSREDLAALGDESTDDLGDPS